VLCIQSGGDIAVELSKVVKKVYLSTRSGSWVLNRVWDRGEPSDLVLLNRFMFALRSISPLWMQNMYDGIITPCSIYWC